MLKVKMLTRFGGRSGKMEMRQEYLLPRDYAQELVDHGLAVLVVEPPPAAAVMEPPPKAAAVKTAAKTAAPKKAAGAKAKPKGK